MRFFVALFVIGVVVVALGFYMNWFKVSSRNNGDASTIIMSVDKDRIGDDTDDAVDQIQGLGRGMGDADHPPTEEPVNVNERPEPQRGANVTMDERDAR